MKPLNLDNRPCSPISSNCVIWQGPDIPCIKLCTGDTVSDIVAKLGTELCTIMDQLNVSNYDLSCFNLAACPPSDFQALIQLLIDKICAANGITTTSTTKSVQSTCPDCVISVAPCFVQGTTTTMQLVDYVQMIANRVCSIVSEIASINSQISVINTTLSDLQTQIDNLPLYTLPSFPVDCILGPGNQALDVIVEALMNDDNLGYCRLLSATGTPSEINTAVLSQCVDDTDQALAALPTVATMSAYYSGSWINSAALGSDASVANALNNIWLALCDVRAFAATLSLSVTDSTSVNLEYTAGVLTAHLQDTGWYDLEGFDYYTGSFATRKPQCRRIGNEIYFRGIVYIPLATDVTGATVINVTSATNYFNVTEVTPYQGAGGVYIDPTSDFTYFNSNGTVGQSVIPSDILSAGQVLDNEYRLNGILGFRKIGISGNLVALSTNFGVSITTDKKLKLTSKILLFIV